MTSKSHLRKRMRGNAAVDEHAPTQRVSVPSRSIGLEPTSRCLVVEALKVPGLGLDREPERLGRGFIGGRGRRDLPAEALEVDARSDVLMP